jgi:prophage regulatory protein
MTKFNSVIAPSAPTYAGPDGRAGGPYASQKAPHPPNDEIGRSRLTILRLAGVKAETGYARSTIYLRISQGLWTRPISLGARAVGWPASEVAAINAARIAGKGDSEIRDLVAKLEASRKALSR